LKRKDRQPPMNADRRPMKPKAHPRRTDSNKLNRAEEALHVEIEATPNVLS
jgi:hypothetical protein